MNVRYGLYLVAKIVACLGISFLLQGTLVRFYPRPPKPLPHFGPPPPLFLSDLLFTFATLGIGLIGAGLLWLAWWDQRRRCRTCLRKLIMPVETGSWGNIVMLGRPRILSICPFGHGTLSEEELHITGRLPSDWQPHDDNIWKELESYGQAGSNRR